jgi:hypothetical protein
MINTIMKVKPELASVLKQASEEVKSWEAWQRSRDPHGCDRENQKVSCGENDSSLESASRTIET